MVYNADEAVRRALASTTNTPGTCQKWTRTQYGAPSAGDQDHDGDADAVDGWLSEPAKYRHPGDRNPPRGAPVAFGGGSHGYGHRAISLGNNQIRSTDMSSSGYSAGHVGTTNISQIEHSMGVHYLGWSETIDGILIPGLKTSGSGGGGSTVLHGIDVSHFNSGLSVARTDAKFVIAKATEGTSYTDPTFKDWLTQAEKAGRLRGAYHFAHGGGVKEADYFLDRIGGYLGEILLALDWETEVSNVSGAHAWLDRVYERTGIRSLIYMSQSVANTYNWSAVARDYDLWVARYNNEIGPTGPWSRVAIWQHTDAYNTGGYRVDGDRFYGTKADWNAYATGAPNPTTRPDTPSTTSTEDVTQMAVTRYRRTDNTVIPNDGEWHQLNLADNDADTVRYSMANGPGTVHALVNLTPQENEIWARFFIVDDKAGETAKVVSHTRKVVVPAGGGELTFYDTIGEPPDNLKAKGWKRKLRVEARAPHGRTQISDTFANVGTS